MAVLSESQDRIFFVDNHNTVYSMCSEVKKKSPEGDFTANHEEHLEL